MRRSRRWADSISGSTLFKRLIMHHLYEYCEQRAPSSVQQPSEARFDLSRSERRRMHVFLTCLVLIHLISFLVIALVAAARALRSSESFVTDGALDRVSSNVYVMDEAFAIMRQDAFRKLDEALFSDSYANNRAEGTQSATDFGGAYDWWHESESIRGSKDSHKTHAM